MIFANFLRIKWYYLKNFLNNSIYIFNAADIPPYNYKTTNILLP